MAGPATMNEAAASDGTSVRYWPWKLASRSGTVWSWFELDMTSGTRYSFHDARNVSIMRVRIAGLPIGTRIRHRMRRLEAPSRRADSMRDGGTEAKKARIQNTPNAR